ncbi:putative methyltransferase-domain-containing protein [Scleroderma yunnanense]
MEDIQESTSVLQQPQVHSEMLIQQAASLLAICAGVAAAGTVQRVFSFESDELGRIEIQLTDIPLDNHDYTSVGGQTWGGACVLAEMIVEHPERFGLGDTPFLGNDGCLGRGDLRILELGAGTGLVGLTVAKLLAAMGNRRATVVATDFHPSILANLTANIDANFPAGDGGDMITVVSHFLDWSSFSSSGSGVLSEPFDVILGADIIYEAEHATWIKNCLKSLLRCQGSSHPPSIFHLVIPLRPTHTFESSTIENVFQIAPQNHTEPAILSKETIFCEAHGDDIGNDLVEYVYYRIGFPTSGCL